MKGLVQRQDTTICMRDLISYQRLKNVLDLHELFLASHTVLMRHAITPKHLSITIAVIVFIMLIGLRFEASWAGGEGYKPEATFLAVETVTPQGEPANTGPDSFNRGDTLETGSYMRQFKTYDYDYPCSIWLDENSNVTIVNAQEDETEFALIAGRIVVDCKAAVSAREARIDVDGKATAVNYSWLHTFDAVLIDGTGAYTHGNVTLALEHNAAISMDTVDNTKPVTTTGFTPEASAAAEFYEWALGDE